MRGSIESQCWLSESAGEEARAQMKAMMEQFLATETAMRLLEPKVNVCYLGPRSTDPEAMLVSRD